MREAFMSENSRPNYLSTIRERENRSTDSQIKVLKKKDTIPLKFGLSYEQPTYFFTKNSIYNDKSFKSPFYSYEGRPSSSSKTVNKTVHNLTPIRNVQEFNIFENKDERRSKVNFTNLDPIVVKE
jgi:hypothetical protein